MPVVSPGFSWSNLMRNRSGSSDLNHTPRDCGRFLWHQFVDVQNAHADAVYVAMFDEADEGTAIFPVVTRADGLPSGTSMVFLNQDGCLLPDDWYLRVTGAAGKFVHSHSTPPTRLDAVLRP
jgi:hypothetical protein